MLAAGAFDRHVHVAGRHRKALRVDQEVLNERFHLGVDLVFWRGDNAAIVDRPRTNRRDAIERLATDLRALAHLGDADKIAIVRVAVVRADDVEVERFVARVWKRAADVVVTADRAGDRTKKTPCVAVLQRDRADAARPVDPDRILCEELFVFVEFSRKAFQEVRYSLLEAPWNIFPQSADPDEARKEAEARHELVDVHQDLAL